MDKLLTWKNIILSFLLCGIFLASFYQHRMALQTHSEMFTKEYTKAELNFTPEVNKIIEELLQESEADWAILWGFTNGKKIGPMHIKQLSIVYEAKKPTVNKLFPPDKTWTLNLFSDYYIGFWKSRTTIGGSVKQSKNSNIQAYFGERGVSYKKAIGIYVESYNHPVAILSLYFKHGQYVNIDKHLKDAADSISEVLEVKYNEK